MRSMTTAPKFIQPYPQAALDGALGLTSRDVAACIGVRHDHLVRDFRSAQWLKPFRESGFKIERFWVKNGNRGRNATSWALDTEAAKAIIAQSRSLIGFQYLKFLVDCERRVAVAEDLIPRLEAIIKAQQVQIADLTARLAALERPRTRKGQKHWRVVVGYRKERTLGLNGERDEMIPVIREIPLENMTTEERRFWEAQHLARLSSGMSKKTAALINREAEPGKVVALVPRSRK